VSVPRYKLTLVNVGGGCRCPFSASVFVHLPVEADGKVRLTDDVIDGIRAKLNHHHPAPPPFDPNFKPEKNLRFFTMQLFKPRKNVLIDKL
jgi:hypothetical protein